MSLIPTSDGNEVPDEILGSEELDVPQLVEVPSIEVPQPPTSDKRQEGISSPEMTVPEPPSKERREEEVGLPSLQIPEAPTSSKQEPTIGVPEISVPSPPASENKDSLVGMASFEVPQPPVSDKREVVIGTPEIGLPETKTSEQREVSVTSPALGVPETTSPPPRDLSLTSPAFEVPQAPPSQPVSEKVAQGEMGVPNAPASEKRDVGVGAPTFDVPQAPVSQKMDSMVSSPATVIPESPTRPVTGFGVTKPELVLEVPQTISSKVEPLVSRSDQPLPQSQNDAEPVTVSYLPCKGLNLTDEASKIATNEARDISNMFIDNGALVTRGGTDSVFGGRPHADTYSINAMFRATYSDGTTAIFAVTTHSTGAWKLYVYYSSAWTELTVNQAITAGVQGRFTQIKDTVIYVQSDIIPIQISRVFNNGAITFKASILGVKAASETLLIEDFETTTGWTESTGTNRTIAYDSNITHFVTGYQGVQLAVTAANTSRTFYKTTTVAMGTYSDGTAMSVEDFIALNLYRWDKEPITYLELRIYVDSTTPLSGTPKYYSYVIIDYPKDGSNLTIKDYIREAISKFGKNTAFAEWESELHDAAMFNLKMRMSWFQPINSPTAFISATVSCVALVMTSANSLGAGAKASVTLDYLRVQRSEPIPKVDNCALVNFTPGEGWSGTYSYDYQKKISEPCTIKLDGDNSAPYTYISYTIPTADRNFTAGFAGDRVFGIRDRVYIRAFTNKLSAGAIQVQFVDGGTRTMTGYFFLGTGAFGGFYHSLPLWAFTDSSGGSFTWNDVRTIKVANLNPAGTYVYLDELGVVLSQLSKVVMPFEAVDVRIAQWATDAMANLVPDNVHVNIPFTGVGVDLSLSGLDGQRAFELWFNHKYKTEGAGSIKYPDTENIERNMLSTCSLTLTSSPNEGSTTVNSIQDLFSPDANDPVEGFKVTWMRPKIMGKLNLDYYYYFSKSGAAGSPITVSKAATADTDKFRCWIRVKNASKLNKIKFRLYVNTADTFSDNFFLPKLTNNRAEDYYEYVMSGQQLMSIKNKKILDNNVVKDTTGFPINIPFYGDVDVNKEKLTNLVYDYYEVAPQKTDENEDWYEGVIEWQKREFIKHGADAANWDDIVGYGLEVVGIGTDDVQVSFDNWHLKTAGPLTGEYFYKVTCMNSQGIEGEPSNISKKVTTNGDYVILQNIPTYGSSYDVQARCVYRMGGSSAEFKLVDILTDNDSSTYVDKFADDQLGKFLEDDFFSPAKSACALVSGNSVIYGNVKDRVTGRLYSSRVHISKPFQPEKIPYGSMLDLRPNDGQYITGMADIYGYLVVFKDRSIWTVDKETLQAQLRVDGIGCIATNSIAVSEDNIYFLSHRGVMSFNGTNLNSGVGYKIKTMTDQRCTDAVGGIWGDYYILWTRSALGIASNSKYFAYHIPNGYWTSGRIMFGYDDNPLWQANTVYTVGNVIRPSRYIGSLFTVVDEGAVPHQSGASEPDWASQIIENFFYVYDGNITWQASIPSYVNVRCMAIYKSTTLDTCLLGSGSGQDLGYVCRSFYTGATTDNYNGAGTANFISSSYRSGAFDFSNANKEKILKKGFIRWGKGAGSNVTMHITPQVDQTGTLYHSTYTAAGEAVYLKPDTGTRYLIATLPTLYTKRLIPTTGIRGYVIDVGFIAAHPLVVSALSVDYDILKER